MRLFFMKNLFNIQKKCYICKIKQLAVGNKLICCFVLLSHCFYVNQAREGVTNYLKQELTIIDIQAVINLRQF